MGKKGILFMSLSLAVLLLTGCVEGIYHVTVNKDGSGDVDFKVAMNPMLLGLAAEEEGGDPISQMKEDAEADGFTVSNYKSGDLVGIQAQQHYDSISDVESFGELFSDSDAASEEMPIKVEKGFLQTTYILDSNFDLTDMIEDENSEFKEMESAMLNSVNFQFLLTLPMEPEEHNASEVIDDGSTMKWQLLFGDENNIYLEAKTWNIANIIYLFIGVVLVVIVGLGSYRRFARK